MKNGGPAIRIAPSSPWRNCSTRSDALRAAASTALPLLGQRQTDRGCRERTLGAQEQRLAQAFLQKCDRARQGRLGRAQPCGRLGEAARFDNGGQLHQMLRVNLHVILVCS